MKRTLSMIFMALMLAGCTGPMGTVMMDKKQINRTITPNGVVTETEVSITPNIKSQRITAGLAGTAITGNGLYGAIVAGADGVGEAIAGTIKSPGDVLTLKQTGQPQVVEMSVRPAKPVPTPEPGL